ncbi:hypothetical protein VOLCADRAFT_61815 [Volvox carteri f. nagariensis]|uniref:Lipoamide acyltransferase component of branched-chain alpha-keto acid dehydrogenase complex, mitochondrial n=1 Tax=Volvox carteri f. nagariensis TaxID=3068 RepID=D8TZY7_VOLCA|nr:uncharacterized protein VOLCADRAFT_61815 [Volvox carteri f. nagariensis]EFJ47090.1 hypothetical protein VOLCADRAFT_61815 [Volvox carteri f. nagariensis]|eukprot:XP_002951985.1 hypothetical protein VOLCADRAFT_61815 [Volvox carteri f. nagariensis]
MAQCPIRSTCPIVRIRPFRGEPEPNARDGSSGACSRPSLPLSCHLLFRPPFPAATHLPCPPRNPTPPKITLKTPQSSSTRIGLPLPYRPHRAAHPRLRLCSFQPRPASRLRNLTPPFPHVCYRHGQPGDVVSPFDKLCDVQSDKAAIEITSRYSGKVLALHHAVGAMVKVGAPEGGTCASVKRGERGENAGWDGGGLEKLGRRRGRVQPEEGCMML